MGDFYNIDTLADGKNALNHMLQKWSLSNVVKKQKLFPTFNGTCIDLFTTNAVEIIESLNVYHRFVVHIDISKLSSKTYTKYTIHVINCIGTTSHFGVYYLYNREFRKLNQVIWR